MKTLSTDDLAIVTGGKNNLPIGGTSNSGNDQMLTTLQGIQSSLKDLSKNGNQGGLFGGQGLLFMTMALAMSNRQSQVVVQGGNGCRRGFCFRSW